MPNPIIAPLYFVSPGQVNFQVPFEVERPNLSITVSTAQGVSNTVNVSLTLMAPGIFSQTANGIGNALVFDPGFKSLNDTPKPGSTVIFYATGLGATTPPAVSGYGGNAILPLNQVTSPFEMYIGGSKAIMTWAVLAPGFAGVYQLNVIPSGEAVGDVVITCRTCSDSNHVHMPQALPNSGDNTSNGNGSVTILYPAGQPTITFSPAFVVAKVAARFDIRPNAGRFTLSVVAKIGSTIVDGTTIQFDPVLGQFTATVPSPAPSVRSFDFSSFLPGLVASDFMCGPKTCPLPGNILPASRIGNSPVVRRNP